MLQGEEKPNNIPVDSDMPESSSSTPAPMETANADQYDNSEMNPSEEFKEPLPPSPIGDDAQGDSQSKEDKPEIVEEKIMVTSKPVVEREGNCYCSEDG